MQQYIIPTIQQKEIHAEGRRKQIIYEDITYPQWRHQLAYHLVTVTGGEYSKWKKYLTE